MDVCHERLRVSPEGWGADTDSRTPADPSFCPCLPAALGTWSLRVMNANARSGRVATGESYIGQITAKRPDYGFVQSPLVSQKHGMDAFAPASALARWQAGDVVCFDLILNAQGKPQASNIRDVLDMEPRGGIGKKIAQAYPTGRAFNGVLAQINATDAFIRCEPVHQHYGTDVFCSAAVLRDVQVGTLVNFELVVNQNQQPQAVNCMVVSQESIGILGVAGNALKAGAKYTPDGMLDTGESYIGKLLVQGDMASIACDDTKGVFGVDVSCPVPDFKVFSMGQPVCFDLVLDDDGRPVARNLRRIMEDRGGRTTTPSTPVGKSYNGVISQITDVSVFIKNDVVWKTTGFDVACSPEVLKGLELGTAVNFQLMVNQKLQPQAVSVRILGPIEDPGIIFGAFGGVKGDQKGGWNQPGPGHQQQQPQDQQQQQEGYAPGTVPTLTGVITGAKEGTGFIQCDEVTNAYGMDSVFPVSDISGKGMNIGDLVDFDLMENQLGQPQATNIRPASEEMKAKRARMS